MGRAFNGVSSLRPTSYGAISRYREGCRKNLRQPVLIRTFGNFDLIEPGEGKLSRRVPRGLGLSNGPRLPYIDRLKCE